MNLRRSAYALILLHTLVGLVHAASHVRLGIGGEPWQLLFVILVIWVAPLAAAWVLGRSPRTGFALLAGSMIGAWLFGVAFHYVLPGADNVAELHHAAGSAAFSASAFALAVVEAVAAVVGGAGVISPWRPGGARRPNSSTVVFHHR